MPNSKSLAAIKGFTRQPNIQEHPPLTRDQRWYQRKKDFIHSS